jgi:hypothetical protein
MLHSFLKAGGCTHFLALQPVHVTNIFSRCNQQQTGLVVALLEDTHLIKHERTVRGLLGGC